MSNTGDPILYLDDMLKSCGPFPLPLPSSSDPAFINPLSQNDEMSNTEHTFSQNDDMSNNVEHFSQADDLAIIALKFQKLSWAEMSNRLSGRDCRKRYHTYVKDNDVAHWCWTSSEDQLLCAISTQASKPTWSRIGEIFEDRTINACQARLRKLWQVTKLEKVPKAPIWYEQPWTEQEIQELSKLHAEGRDWVRISEILNRATGHIRAANECMRRLQSEHLLTYPSPIARGNQWTAERAALVETLRKAGETWEYISRRLEAKGVYFTADECRGFWYNSCWEEYRLWIREDGTLHLPL